MTHLPIESQCPEARACAWSSHRRKHFPFKGMVRADTIKEPAKYLWGMTRAEIRSLERQTVQTGTRIERSPTHSEYLREIGEVIGWDEGRDATVSFAECSGGTNASRAFHGRPMSTPNRKVSKR